MRQSIFYMRRGTGQPMEVCDGDSSYSAIRTNCLHYGVQDTHGDCHVSWVGGDAGLTGSDYCKLSAVTGDRGTAGAWIPFVAGLVGVIKVRAASALQQVSGSSSHIT